MHHTVTTTDRLLRRLALAAATVGVLVLSACGSDNSDDEGDDGGGPGGGEVSSAVRDGGEPADTSPAARPDADFTAEVTVADSAVGTSPAPVHQPLRRPDAAPRPAGRRPPARTTAAHVDGPT